MVREPSLTLREVALNDVPDFDPRVALFLLETQLAAHPSFDSPERLVATAMGGSFASVPKPGDPGGLAFFYRGQVDGRWGVRSSLHRVLEASASAGQVYEPRMMEAERAIIKEMNTQGLGRGMTPLQLITVLQHHGIPTRLIDVSRHPLEALFFATDREDTTSGRLFLLGARPGAVTAVDLAREPRDVLSWSRYARGKTQAGGQWTNQVHLIDGAIYDARMLAQGGAFLYGGLAKAYAGEAPYHVNGRNFDRATTHRLTNLSIAFPRRGAKKKATKRPVVAWTIEIPADWKPRIRELLAAERVTRDTMYPPFSEARRLGIDVANRF